MTPDQRTVNPAAADLQLIALDLLHIAAKNTRRAQETGTDGVTAKYDRALAHCIRAAVRAGLNARTVAAETHLSEDDVTACLGRWPGDE